MQNNGESARPLVLVADDDRGMRTVAVGALAVQGVDVVTATNGAEALRLFQEHNPDLLLLDVQMPVLDGFKVCARIRAGDHNADTPVIMVTGLDDQKAISKAYKVGATDFVVKPVEWTVLGQRIQYVLRASRSARDLATSRRQLTMAQRIASTGSWVWDPTGDAMEWSEELHRILGIPAGPGAACMAHLQGATHPDDAQRVQGFLEMCARKGGEESLEHRVVQPGGQMRWVRHRTAPGGDDSAFITGTVQDITQDVEMERQLANVQKMEALGVLSAGILHEIANPVHYASLSVQALEEDFASLLATLTALQSVMGRVEERQLTPDQACSHLHGTGKLDALPEQIEDVSEGLGAARTGLSKVTEILQHIRRYNHPGEDTWKLVDLREEIEGALSIANNELKYTCEIVREFASIPRVRCQGNRLGQVFVNLFVNAAHSMAKGGTLTVVTRPVEGGVQVVVSDTGTGIPLEIQEQIFRPFFTTKPEGVGTGLGLHVVRGIVQEQGGTLELESTEGEGTSFTITLPAGQLEAETLPPAPTWASTEAHDTGGAA